MLLVLQKEGDLIKVRSSEVVRGYLLSSVVTPLTPETAQSEYYIEQEVDGRITYSQPIIFRTAPHNHGHSFKPQLGDDTSIPEETIAFVKVPINSASKVRVRNIATQSDSELDKLKWESNAPHSLPQLSPDNTTVKLMVINFNPILEAHGGQRLTQYKGWNDPNAHTNAIISDMTAARGGDTAYTIVENHEVDDFPVKQGGYDFTDQSYLNCVDGGTCNDTKVNYNAIFDTYDVCEKLNAGTIDEVWLWGGPFFGYWESTMAGPNPFDMNNENQPIEGTSCASKIIVMGFNYQAPVMYAMESMGHRIEKTVIHLYGGMSAWAYRYWNFPSQPPTNPSPWEYFTAHGFDNGIMAGCGVIHGSLNTPIYNSGNPWFYDYLNQNVEPNRCLDYPAAQTQQFSCGQWGCDERAYKRFWISRIPDYWWGLALDYDNSPLTGPLPNPSPIPVPAPPTAATLSASVNGSQVTLTWNSVPGAISYFVYRCRYVYCSNFILMGQFSTRSYTETLPSDDAYKYRVRAYNGQFGANSNEVVARRLSNFKVFVTSTTRTGNMGGLQGADAYCQQRANSAGLEGSFAAWLSTANVNARDRIPDATYSLTNGVVIANNKNDLLDYSLPNPINRTETGTIITTGTTSVFTSSHADGVGSGYGCNAWTSNAGAVLSGSVLFSNGLWSNYASRNCGENLRVYCFQVSNNAPTGTPTPTPTYPPAPTATATPTITPTPTPIAEIRKVFVTSTTHTGDLDGLTGADAICQTRKTAAGLLGTYKAWLSTSNVHAKDRLVNAPFRLVDGTTVIANSISDLTDMTIANPINKNEFGQTVNNAFVYTGTGAVGYFSSPGCYYWTLTGTDGRRGNTSNTNGGWTSVSGVMSCTNQARIYCFQVSE